MNDRWQNAKKHLDKIRIELHEKRGVRNQLLKSRQEESDLMSENQSIKIKSEKAYLFLLSEITTRRKQAVGDIQTIASSALQMSHGDGYGIQFYDFEDVRKAGTNSFKMEIQMISPYGKNGKSLVTKLFGSRGGGGIEVAAYSLRMGALDWLKYSGPVLLDEFFKSLSRDKKVNQVAKWFRLIHEVTGRQTICTTHMGDIFGKIADKILYVSNDCGKSSVKEIAYDELAYLQLDDDDLSEDDNGA